jgi:hypothetical protein
MHYSKQQEFLIPCIIGQLRQKNFHKNACPTFLSDAKIARLVVAALILF